jgi:hypothetical protein
MVWSEKAIEAALSAIGYFHSNSNYQKMCAALDAAAAVDGDAEWNAAISRAAHIVIAFGVKDYSAEEVAARIRTLKRG